MSARAVITGAGILCSVGGTKDELHDALCAGRCGIRSASDLFDTEGLGPLALAPLVDFDPAAYLSRRQANMLDRLSQATLGATHQALGEAGTPQAGRAERSGVVVASTYATTKNLLAFYRDAAAVGTRRANPLWLRYSNPSTVMAICAIQHELAGVNVTVASGETSSIDGLLHSCNAIQSGACEVMLLVACESVFVDLLRYFDQRQLLAHRDQKTLRSVPYGSDSSGAVLGECAVALVLESADHARSDRVLGEVIAASSRSGDPGQALHLAIERALADGGVEPTEVQFIIGAGNGYRSQDAIEAAVLEKFFGSAPLLTSIKGSIGESLSAAGLASVLAAVQAGRGGLLPPVHSRDERSDTALSVVREKPADVGHGVALVCTIGHLGGAAVALIAV